MSTRKSVVSARQQAHRALATRRQQRIEREKANESDLAAYLLIEEQIREAVRVHRDAITALRCRQGNHLRQWRGRGEKLSAIAELTGRSAAELSRLIKATAAPTGGQIRQTSRIHGRPAESATTVSARDIDGVEAPAM